MSQQQHEVTSSSDFVDKYLEHLQRRDSREGVTKWILLVAVAALFWKLSNLIFASNWLFVGRTVALCLLAYYIIETAFIFGTNTDVVNRLRFKLRLGYRVFSGPGLFTARVLATSICIFAFFKNVSEVYIWLAAGPPLLLGIAFLFAMFGELRQKYDVLNPSVTKSEKSFKVGLVAIFVVPALVGCVEIFLSSGMPASFIDPQHLSSIQAAGLIVVILLILEKYAKSLRDDSEIAAVRRIWRRKGIGELSAEGAAKELRLIIAGASLSEVTSEDVSELSKNVVALEDEIKTAENQLDRLTKPIDDSLFKDAVTDSLAKRASEISRSFASIQARREEILKDLKRMVHGDIILNPEVKELEDSLNQRTRSLKPAIDSLFKKIAAADIAIDGTTGKGAGERKRELELTFPPARTPLRTERADE